MLEKSWHNIFETLGLYSCRWVLTRAAHTCITVAQGFGDGIILTPAKVFQDYLVFSLFQLLVYSCFFDLSYPTFYAPTTNIGTAVNLANSLESRAHQSNRRVLLPIEFIRINSGNERFRIRHILMARVSRRNTQIIPMISQLRKVEKLHFWIFWFFKNVWSDRGTEKY